MTKVRLLPAVGAGFSLIAREPLSALAWGLVLVVLTVGPLVLFFGMAGPAYIQFFTGFASHPGAPPEIPPALRAAQALQPLQLLGALAAAAIVYPAIFRAVLFPDQRRWAYLRLGATEFYVGVMVVVLYVLFFVALVVVLLVTFIPAAIFVGVGVSGGGDGGIFGAILLAMVVVIATMMGFLYIFGRLWIGAPMTVATGQLKLFDGWNLTRGYGLPLFGMAFLVVLIVFGLELVVFAIVGAVGLGALSVASQGDLQSLFSGAGLAHLYGPIVIGYAATMSVLLTAITPVMIAPWARAYQLLASEVNMQAGEAFT